MALPKMRRGVYLPHGVVSGRLLLVFEWKLVEASMSYTMFLSFAGSTSTCKQMDVRGSRWKRPGE